MDRLVDKYLLYLRVEKNASNHTITNYADDLKDFDKFILDLKITISGADAVFTDESNRHSSDGTARFS